VSNVNLQFNFAMTESLQSFLDDVKIATKSVSDSQMASKFELTRSAVSSYRKGKAYPSDSTMMSMAKRAGIDPTEALLMLNVWRSEGETKRQYEIILQSMLKYVAAFLIRTKSRA